MRSKRRIPFAIRNLALAVALSTAGSQAGAVLVADGKLGTNALGGPTSGAAAAAAEGYTSGWSIGFQDDKGNLIGNGQLWFGTDLAGAQYLYFQLPFDYVDNCYNTSAAACPGWGGGGHTFKDLLNSDSMGANPNFTWTDAAAGGATNAARIDYLADCSGGLGCNTAGYKSGGVGFPVTGQGAAGTNGGGAKWMQMDSALTGSAASILEIATSLEYNLEKFGTGFETNSSSDPNWVKEVGYEIKFAAGTFDPVKWANPNVQAVNDKGNITIQVPGLLTLGDPHVSPPKVTFGGYTSPCMIGNPLCTPVPEPSTPLLLLGGLAGMAWYARRRRESSRVVVQRASSPS